MRCRILAASCLTCAVLSAQTPPAPGPKFEVASIKVSQSPIEMMRAGRGMVAGGPVLSGTRVDIGTMAMKNLIATAYGTDIQHVAAPAWTLQSYFSIQAVMPEGATKEQFPDMLQALLAERFHLTSHRATSDQTAYALTIAKNGPKLKAASEVDRSGCDKWTDDRVISGAKTCSFVQQADTDRTTITINTDSRWGPRRTENSRRALEAEFFAITMPQLADYLASTLRTAGPGLAQGTYVPILDRTELQGKWRLTVERVFADAALSPPDGPVERMPITVSLVADELAAGISKMGLKLEKTTAPVEMIVIDHVDQTPTEN
jgi:uncharacterized protein (TIGR03435 family)